MVLKPHLEDFKIIGYYLGKIIIGIGLFMLIPLFVALGFREIAPTFDFLIGIGISFFLGFVLTKICFTDKDLNWMQGMIIVSLSWLVATIIGSIPLYLSGHFKSYLDACFESMSGFATTGLTLVQDLDHLSYTHNLWRHLVPFLGGQGIAIVALSLFVSGSSGAFKMYVGEAREEKILPNVIHTARFIWVISIIYLLIGTISLGITGILIGMKPQNAFFHGVCIFMAGFDTAGFAPQSQNLLYYHSFPFEIVTIFIMIVGTLNFNLHYHLWNGNYKEIFKNIETRTLLSSSTLIFFIVALGLKQLNVYPGLVMFFRKGFFQFISGHSTTGFQTIYAQQFIKDWGALALGGIICAMALGGCACSTAGGIKMLRLGIILKALKEDIRRIMLPEKAMVVQRFHHIKNVFLDNKQVRSALLITLCYLALYFTGALIGMFCGYPFLESLFESTSAAANIGFSCGITDVSMPAILKITYMIQMWAGRLEFMSIFTLLGFIVAAVKGK
ncbi:MAG: TrkH family potassium uptake protein [Candidatus Omnitrophica bacterium]|nr:TrkH family potassium uptake protein [Candidatus Omnitrophota bacterium]